jgi:hypothetical protein
VSVLKLRFWHVVATGTLGKGIASVWDVDLRRHWFSIDSTADMATNESLADSPDQIAFSPNGQTFACAWPHGQSSPSEVRIEDTAGALAFGFSHILFALPCLKKPLLAAGGHCAGGGYLDRIELRVHAVDLLT